MTANTKRSLKTRIKHYTPEIIVGASVVAGVAGLIYIRKTMNIDVVAGGEEACVAMTAEALNVLEKFGKLEIGDKNAIKYVLSLPEVIQ